MIVIKELEELSLIVPDSGIKMIYIDPKSKPDRGTFMMGSPEGEFGRDDDEKQYRVTLTDAYWLGEYPVTQEEWEQIMGNNPSHFTSSDKRAPVEQVSWLDAKEFIKKLNERERSAGRLPEGYEYSLPTEAQWEYACRAGTETPFAFGASLSSRQANFNGLRPYAGTSVGAFLDKTSAVKSYNPNKWGLYDMHGNVSEWCENWYNKDILKSALGSAPIEPHLGSHRVHRGGGWSCGAKFCRSASRRKGIPSNRSSMIGFRLSLRTSN